MPPTAPAARKKGKMMETGYFLQWHSSAVGWYDVRELADKAEADKHRRKIGDRCGVRVVERSHAA